MAPRPTITTLIGGLLPILLVGTLIGLSAIHASEPGSNDRTVLRLREDTYAVLHNPGMGWVLYENYPLDPAPNGSSTMIAMPDESFPDVDAVAIMFSWQDVEIREGEYDFSRVDKAYDYWRRKGKEIQLRLSTDSLVWWAKRIPPAGLGVPDYLLSRLPTADKQTRNMEGFSYVVVDARNSLYREHLKVFLQAVNMHFDQRRPVTLIDLRGFGVWGEWHSGFHYADINTRRSALMGILNIWSAAFPQQCLALSYSYDPDGRNELYAGQADHFDPVCTTNYNEYLAYSAFDHALTLTNITFRRDGCGGAVHSNERRLNEEAYRKFHRAPMMGEFLGGYQAVSQAGSKWASWMVEDALSLHPNYLNLIGGQAGDARAFASERSDLVHHGLRRMGYRLMLEEVEYPRVVSNGVPFIVRFEWVNRGVGRALADFSLRLTAVRTDGSRSEEMRTIVPSTQWLEGEKHEVSVPVTFKNLPLGNYWLNIQLTDPGTQRAIALPLTSDAKDCVYPVGRILVQHSN